MENIYDLYEAKKQAYNNYRIELGVFTSKLEECKKDILSKAENVQQMLQQVTDGIVSQLCTNYLAVVKAIDFYDAESISTAYTELEKITNELETYLRGKLNEV